MFQPRNCTCVPAYLIWARAAVPSTAMPRGTIVRKRWHAEKGFSQSSPSHPHINRILLQIQDYESTSVSPRPCDISWPPCRSGSTADPTRPV